MIIQELEFNMSPPTSGSDNPELGFEALTRVVKKVLEEVFEGKIREISETLQARCVDCRKKRGCDSPRLEPRSAKHGRTHLSYSKCSASSDTSVPCWMVSVLEVCERSWVQD
ncbi:hypothetical protein J1N35_044879 [Gossypium stocksii]|uniref:Uncharacterized protein n=1 Tax=Gossypium stocksii TaxID=47602 RepID=A0A9D3ZGE6_9ROSI|nr:hypothetical protein J1N35_044879 [Gossypium stocksii]